jgi:cellulose synthase/poly-beta-1,6-N-acetylglucosamine synthase-like glycosyltransferase
MTQKKVSVIIPVKPGGAVKALEGLGRVDYPAALLEILVAYGKQPSRQRNRAAETASGEILYFLDDDSMVSPQFLLRTAGHYDDPVVAAVGGPSLTPETDTPLRQSFGLALASLFGGGGVRNRYRKEGDVRETGDKELILCNLSFRREVYLALGGLDERLYPNEENELLERIKRRGWRLIHDPELAVRRSQRGTFKAFVRQLFTYGRGRAEQTLIGGVSGMASFIPSLFLIYLCLLPFFNRPVYYLPLLCYVVTLMFFAMLEALRSGHHSALPRLLVIFPALHLAYGAGMLWGFVFPRFKRVGSVMAEVTIRKVKGAGIGDPQSPYSKRG